MNKKDQANSRGGNKKEISKQQSNEVKGKPRKTMTTKPIQVKKIKMNLQICSLMKCKEKEKEGSQRKKLMIMYKS